MGVTERQVSDRCRQRTVAIGKTVPNHRVSRPDGSAFRPLSVSVLAVPDSLNLDDMGITEDLVNDPVISHTNAIVTFEAGARPDGSVPSRPPLNSFERSR